MSIILLSYLFSNLYDGLKLGKEPFFFVAIQGKSCLATTVAAVAWKAKRRANVRYPRRGFAPTTLTHAAMPRHANVQRDIIMRRRLGNAC